MKIYNRKFKIDCFEKKSNRYIYSIDLPKNKSSKYRNILGKWDKNIIIDQVKINKALKVKFEVKFKIKINIRNYDCFFSECI